MNLAKFWNHKAPARRGFAVTLLFMYCVVISRKLKTEQTWRNLRSCILRQTSRNLVSNGQTCSATLKSSGNPRSGQGFRCREFLLRRQGSCPDIAITSTCLGIRNSRSTRLSGTSWHSRDVRKLPPSRF